MSADEPGIGDLANQLAKGAVWIAIARWSSLILSMFTLVILARMLGPEGWGIYAAAMIPIALAQPLFDGAFGEGLIRRNSLEKGHIDAAFWAGMALAIVIWSIIALAAGPIAVLLRAPDAVAVLPALASVLALSAASVVPEALLARDLRLRDQAAAEVLATVIGSILGLLAAANGADVWSLVVMEVARQGVKLAWQMRATGWFPGLALRSSHFKDLAGFNGVAVAIRCVAAADRALPRLAITTTLGAAALGQFALAYRVYDQVSQLFVGPMNALALPAAVKAKASPQALRRLLAGAVRVSSLVCYPAFLGLAVVSPVLVPFAFGESWTDAAIGLQILCLLGLRAAVSSFSGGILRGADRAMWHLGAMLASLLVLIVVLPFTAHLGVIAVAGVLVVRGFAMWPITAVLVRRTFGASWMEQVRAGSSALVAALVMASTVWAIDASFLSELPPLPRLIAMVSLGAATYVASVAVLMPHARRAMVQGIRDALDGDRGGIKRALVAFVAERA
jgi:O-antigen/teichoic acid export membrane protein